MIIPLLLLGVIEAGLRLAGYGFDPALFKTISIKGEQFYVNNDSFSLRFFPPQMTRGLGAIRMPVRKSAGTYRIFILGESAAVGDPEPAYGAGRYLEALLGARYPGTHFEIINTGITAIDSHVILPIARECARHDGDLWIIYMGNNEMVGPFGAATVFGAKAPSLALVRLNLAIRKTRLGQLLANLARKLTGGSANAPSWGWSWRCSSATNCPCGRSAQGNRVSQFFAEFARHIESGPGLRGKNPPQHHGGESQGLRAVRLAGQQQPAAGGSRAV